MRDTNYATEYLSAVLPLSGGEEARVERLYVKEQGQVEIRFSWWKNGNIVPRALDLSENDWLALFRRGLDAGVFTDDFRARLREIV